MIDPSAVDSNQQSLEQSQGAFREIAQTVLAGRAARTALIVLGVYLLVAIVVPLLPFADFAAQDRSAALQAPSFAHLFGTDHLGRDILIRTAYSVRTTLLLVGAAAAGAAVIGVTLGLIAGYFGGFAETVIMRVCDCLLAFPVLLLAIFITGILGPNATNAAIALAIVGVPEFARMARVGVLVERERDYVGAARSIGVSSPRIMFVHILPNVLGPLLTQLTLFVALAILVEAALSFVGLGVQIPEPSLGSMLAESRSYFREAWWFVLAPGLTIAVLVWSINSIADRLRDAFDPSMASGR